MRLTDEERRRAARQAQATAKANKQKVLDDAAAYGRTICTADHTTWQEKARCLWPGLQVEGEGPYAVVVGGVVYLTDKPQVVRLHRGIHRPGGGG
ncbi:hypothetical protein [Nocardioides antri]|uniref:Uncharacterized protein n=1 Tax=Nocardioides antri TaxID=2607659 RepID=A0A5B1LUL1_9ACTN|nr:hypothetical protein [Nocardioides antri]KAA1424321.1 hypothetical protein F0U47_18990 [Nocardioides antri]